MTVMRVLMVELLCQVAIGWISALECLLPGVDAYGYLLYCLALYGLATRGSRLLGHVTGTSDPKAWLPGVRAHAELGQKEELDQADM
jgi:hypothetical protein